MRNVAIYGVGNFGYAILKHLDKYKSDSYKIKVYDRNPLIRRSLIVRGDLILFFTKKLNYQKKE